MKTSNFTSAKNLMSALLLGSTMFMMTSCQKDELPTLSTQNDNSSERALRLESAYNSTSPEIKADQMNAISTDGKGHNNSNPATNSLKNIEKVQSIGTNGSKPDRSAKSNSLSEAEQMNSIGTQGGQHNNASFDMNKMDESTPAISIDGTKPTAATTIANSLRENEKPNFTFTDGRKHHTSNQISNQIKNNDSAAK